MKEMGVSRTFMGAPGLRNRPDIGDADYRRYAVELQELIPLYEGQGFEVGVWFGPTLGWDMLPGGESPYTEIIGHTGAKAPGIFCPLDGGFTDEFCRRISILASSGVKMMMFEDDFRLHLRPTVPFGCFCPLHIAAFTERTGLALSREEIVEKVLRGGPNEVRDA